MTSHTSTPFVLDTNIFIEAQRRYYAQDLCPGFWQCLDHFYREGRVLSIDRVHDELLTGKDWLANWARMSPLFTPSAEQSVVDEFAGMIDWVQRNRQFTQPAKAEFAGAADGWVAAYAKAHDAMVVTHEVWRPEAKKRVPLPNVCRQFGVRYADTFEMLRGLCVHFDWSASSP